MRHARSATSKAGRNRHSGATSDRKSTRLNSSHRTTSYADFCLKKKTTVPCLAALLLLAGCHDPLTEILLVIDSDLKVSTEGDSIAVRVDDVSLSKRLGPRPLSF